MNDGSHLDNVTPLQARAGGRRSTEPDCCIAQLDNDATEVVIVNCPQVAEQTVDDVIGFRLIQLTVHHNWQAAAVTATPAAATLIAPSAR